MEIVADSAITVHGRYGYGEAKEALKSQEAMREEVSAGLLRELQES